MWERNVYTESATERQLVRTAYFLHVKKKRLIEHRIQKEMYRKSVSVLARVYFVNCYTQFSNDAHERHWWLFFSSASRCWSRGTRKIHSHTAGNERLYTHTQFGGIVYSISSNIPHDAMKSRYKCCDVLMIPSWHQGPNNIRTIRHFCVPFYPKSSTLNADTIGNWV